MGIPDGRKCFKIGLAVLVQYQRVTDTQRDRLTYTSRGQKANSNRTLKAQ